MQKKLTPLAPIIFFLATGVFVTRYFDQKKINSVTHQWLSCQRQVNTSSVKCAEPASSIELRPAVVPDRTVGWEAFSLQDFHIAFRHPTFVTVTVDPPLHDVILRRIRVGSAMILESVSAGTEGVAGDNPVDYYRLVYNSIAQNTRPNWTNYNPGYSSEKFGDVTLYSFHTNIFDMLSSPKNALIPTTSDGLPMQGVIFDPVHSGDWLVFFNPQNEILADDILRTMSLD